MAKKKFKNLSLSQKTIIFLLFFKKAEEVGTRGKYRVFFHGGFYYFVGKSGAVRVYSKPTVTKSRSITDKYKSLVREWAKGQDQCELIEIP